MVASIPATEVKADLTGIPAQLFVPVHEKQRKQSLIEPSSMTHRRWSPALLKEKSRLYPAVDSSHQGDFSPRCTLFSFLLLEPLFLSLFFTIEFDKICLSSQFDLRPFFLHFKRGSEKKSSVPQWKKLKRKVIEVCTC